jgi:hypothetical protein
LKKVCPPDSFVIDPAFGIIEIGILGPAAQLLAQVNIRDVVVAQRLLQLRAVVLGHAPAIGLRANIGQRRDARFAKELEKIIQLVVGMADAEQGRASIHLHFALASIHNKIDHITGGRGFPSWR